MTTTNDKNNKTTARVAVVVHLRVIGMMCQRNCGSTVRRALLGVDLSDLVGASADGGGGAPPPLNARVVDAMADHATSYARVVVEWGAVAAVDNDDDEDDEDIWGGGGGGGPFVIDDDDDDDGGGAPLSSEEREKLAEAISTIAIDAVECVGFEAARLSDGAEARAHRVRAAYARREDGGGDGTTATARAPPPPQSYADVVPSDPVGRVVGGASSAPRRRSTGGG